ncbi:hypothetical protein T4A_6130 [Trichinella pseudospiralis]|uniref:Uncharacterized protein n=1 Tax=Trichinella pseudospiralis TaxID=6337 RepID=A0A0V1DZJ9_TRIPS|nr:hypothetical protein T4A_6130 [Trichinella pseudospiralis]KRZ35281.1 hypothetical protein T4C_6811 [Trichinella pseudospiralis]
MKIPKRNFKNHLHFQVPILGIIPMHACSSTNGRPVDRENPLMIREQPLENSVEDVIALRHHCSALLKCFVNRFDDSDAYKRDYRNHVLVANAGRNWHGMTNRRYQNYYMLIIESSFISGVLARFQDPVVYYLKFITERNLTNYTYHSFCQTQLQRLVNRESYISSVLNAIYKNYHLLDENPMIEQGVMREENVQFCAFKLGRTAALFL